MDYNLPTTWTFIIAVAAIWELFWKGFALWRAARLNQPDWFIALLVINSVGILSIAYLFTHRDAES